MKSFVLWMAACLAAPALAQDKADPLLKRGRYLIQIAGCNDCHTAGYAPSAGKVPESEWLLGDALGWNGPWGTTYATNLRLYMQDFTEEQWVKKARTLNARPPMPWFNVRNMSDEDLRAIYRYIRLLGPAGKPAPAYLRPGKRPPQPFVRFPVVLSK